MTVACTVPGLCSITGVPDVQAPSTGPCLQLLGPHLREAALQRMPPEAEQGPAGQPGEAEQAEGACPQAEWSVSVASLEKNTITHSIQNVEAKVEGWGAGMVKLGVNLMGWEAVRGVSVRQALRKCLHMV